MKADSSLVTTVMPAYAGNYTSHVPRSNYSKIKKITIHHTAYIGTVESLGRLWQTVGRNGSSHYGVGGDYIGQYVNEDHIAWTDTNWDSNVQSVTIETFNSTLAPNWEVSGGTLNTLIRLVADIAKRNNLHPLVVGKTLTWHQMYYSTQCCGPYLMSKMDYICEQANKINNGEEIEPMFMSTQPVAMRLGKMTGMDLLGMKDILDNLQINYIEKDGVIDTEKISKGDQPRILEYANLKGIDFVPLCEDVEQYIAMYDKLKTEYEKTLTAVATLNDRIHELEQNINSMQEGYVEKEQFYLRELDNYKQQHIALKEENTELQEEIQKLKNEGGETPPAKEKTIFELLLEIWHKLFK